MGIFSRRPDPEVKAAAYTSADIAIAGGDPALVWGSTYRWRAMRIPTISRARDLICTTVGALPLRAYNIVWDPERLEYAELRIQDEPWMVRPNERTTRSHMIAWTVDDLVFHGRAYWLIQSRYSTGYPASFLRLPADEVNLQADMWEANAPIGTYTITWRGAELDPANVVIFYSPIQSLLETGSTAIIQAERLGLAATRFATTPAAMGWLRQVEGEDLTSAELAELAAVWAEARDTSAVAALNRSVEWHESSIDPDRLQLIQARQHSALELSRVANIPPYLVGAETSSFTYANAQQARQDLILFGCAPYIAVIEETLSGPAVSSRSRIIRFDKSAWLDAIAPDSPNGALPT